MPESSSSEFFRTTTGVQSGSLTKLVMTFLSNFEVTETLCKFRLFLEGKGVKEIPGSSRSYFLKRFSEKNSTIADLTLLRTLFAIRQSQMSQVYEKWETLLALLA